MLPYHILYSQKRQQNDSQFVHYLSLGSYSTWYNHPNIISFSKIMLTPKKYLPKLNYDDLKVKCQSEGYKLHNLVIPLYGNFMIDQKHIFNLLQPQYNEKQQQNKENKQFQVKQCRFVKDVEYISNKQEKDKNGTFLYLLYRTKQSTQQTAVKYKQSHADRFNKLVDQKSINHCGLDINAVDVELSFVQLWQNTKVELKQNDLFYLQRGRVSIQIEGLNKVEIKNKGNRKGQQNYIDNMIYVSQRMSIQIEKGSMFFIVSTKKTEE